MLKKLLIENYALIDSLELELGPSLNIITGETGAGKSIILGALGLLLGNRADTTALKVIGRNCIVEGIFAIDRYGLEEFFAENDLEFEVETVIRRVISPGGKGRAYVNDLPVQLATLKELGSQLIDIHSQHQSQMLGKESYRIGLLDSIAGNGMLRSLYQKAFDQLTATCRELEKVRDEISRQKQDQDWLEFQLGQMTQCALSENEQEELESELNELSHSEDIKEALQYVAGEFEEDERGVIGRLGSMITTLERIYGYYPRAAELCQRIESARIELKDVNRELGIEGSRMEFDPGRLRVVGERLDIIYSLQQKHRVSTIAELLGKQAEFQQRLDMIAGGDDALSGLESQRERFAEQAASLAAEITLSRKQAGLKLREHVEQTLSGLGMPSARFEAEVESETTLGRSGADNVRFMFSANTNIPMSAAEKTASGGEISRLMLSIKSMVARCAKLPTIIFDEIDTGVSGSIADATGKIILGISNSMQVINITHLPQVACMGDHHFVVYKDNTENDTPHTRISLLAPGERIDEIAKMLSGSTVTEAARDQAALLLGSGH